jgi:hypothetical protein
MALSRRSRVMLGAALPAFALAVTTTPAAQAASTTGWRIVFSHHYGAPAAFQGFLAVTAPGKGAAWATGGAGGNGNPATGFPVAARWHNGTWRAARLPSGLSGTLGAVSADSAKDAWTVSIENGYALHWNGTKWSVARRWHEPSTLPKELTGVIAFSPTNVWVFGGPGAFPGLGTWHFNGHLWQHVTTAPADGIVTASALSATNMWAIGSATSPQDSIVHYTGTWRTVSATALSGLSFSAIAAVSAHDVWAVGTIQTNGFRPRLVHMTSRGWTRTSLPWLVHPIDLAPDGSGGLWITAQNNSGQFAIHRSAAGSWSRIRIGPDASLIRIALIPGTTSLWGAGAVKTTSGANAAVWAHGRLP